MPKLFQVKYNWFGRASIWDGERWVKLSKEASERQRQIDLNFAANEKILSEMRVNG